jgi:hypothetical protein
LGVGGWFVGAVVQVGSWDYYSLKLLRVQGAQLPGGSRAEPWEFIFYLLIFWRAFHDKPMRFLHRRSAPN